MPEAWEEWIDDLRLPARRLLPHDTVAALIHASLEFQQDRATWRLHACVLMPDHVHLIATVSPETRLAHTVTYWKRYLARQAGTEWQRDFFEHRLRRDEHFDAKVEYLRMNPVRAGLVVAPDEWPYFWAW